MSSGLESFHYLKPIAHGGFGVVDEGVGPNSEPVAIKQELFSKKVTRPTLEHEYHVYQLLAGHDCILDVKAYGRLGKFNLMVMDLLGPSLGDRFWKCANRFTLLTTARLGLGMLDAIEYIHSKGFIHRDIKPENFLLGRGIKSHVVHPVDFGLARRWGSSASSTVEGGTDGVGTLAFASINAHLGKAQSRRDDLQALTYTIIKFARGSLPWDHIRGGTHKHLIRRVLEKKRSWTAARLCQGLPRELELFSGHCFDLSFEDEPDYHLLRENLTDIAKHEGWNVDSKFEWEELGWIASTPPEPEASLIQAPPPLPRIKRGDIVLLKLNPEQSLDYEPPPRSSDTSFFPHPPPTEAGVEWSSPYRPAVVRNVTSDEDDDVYFNFVVYPLTRRSSLDGLSTRRSRCFLQLETLIDSVNGKQVPCNDVFLYKTSLMNVFKVEYGQPITCQFSVPEGVLTEFEAVLSKVPTPYSTVYDSDDEETRTTLGRLPRRWDYCANVMEMRSCSAADFLPVPPGVKTADIVVSSTNGWIPEMISVQNVRIVENGEDGSELDDDSDEDTEFWDWPRAVNRRRSCTVEIASAAD